MSSWLPPRLCAVAVVGALAVSPAAARATPPLNADAFAWLKPSHPLPGWKLAVPPSGSSALWYPPVLRVHAGDTRSVTVELRHPSARVVVFVNAGPKNGRERLQGWESFRVAHLHYSDHDIRVLANASGLRFTGGGIGACVLDQYTTAVANHHYREIACFVRGFASQSVIVAAALLSAWPEYRAELERVIAAWQVN
jgi:hypothetical protein